MQKTVVIVQYRLLHYRVSLFERLKVACAQRGVQLELVVGQATRRERQRADEGKLDWAYSVINRVWEIGKKDWVWQPIPNSLRHAELVVVMQESRLLANYLLIVRRALGSKVAVAYWGHGRNFQSDKPNGWRERWKRWMILPVDWWFAYTKSSTEIVRDAGFPSDRITCLNNTINGSGFMADLASVTTDELTATRNTLGISETSQVAIYCGSIYAEKRIALLLEAADLLRIRLADFHLIVVGDGPEAPSVATATASRPWLHFQGLRKGREKALNYRLASVMLNPGAVGLHIVDAFAARTPLVTQRSAMHGPEYDYLVDGVNGRSVNNDSADSYAAVVASVFTQPGLLAGMQARCADDAQVYTLERMVQNFASGIAACLARNGNYR